MMIAQLSRSWRANIREKDNRRYKIYRKSQIINVLWEIGKTDIDVLCSFLYEYIYLYIYVHIFCISMHVMRLGNGNRVELQIYWLLVICTALLNRVIMTI